MLKTVAIVPAILTNDPQNYRAQAERINTFTRRVQIDASDGNFVPATTLDVTNVWWPKDWTADLHYMAATPSQNLDTIVKLKPSLCILHAEASENLLPIFEALKQAGIKTGVALLPQTYPGNVKAYIDVVDHVLIMAGQIGTQGSPADLMQMEKIPLIRAMRPEVEIGWDGGANMSNLRALAHTELNVIYVGSAIAASPDPAAAYQALVAETDKNGVAL